MGICGDVTVGVPNQNEIAVTLEFISGIGDDAILRESNEPVRVLAVVDAAGTLLVRCGEEEFTVARDELMRPEDRHAGCC